MKAVPRSGLEKATARCLTMLMVLGNLPAAVSSAAPASRPDVAGPGASGVETVRVRVSDPSAEKAALEHGGRLVADYGGFKVLAVPSSEAPAVTQSGADELRGQDFILLNSGALRTSGPAASARRALGSFSGKRLHLVQFAGPVKAEWYAELQATGVQVVSYIANNAYLVRGDASQLAKAQGLHEKGFLQWDGSFEPAYKIQTRTATTKQREALAAGVQRYVVQLVADASTNSTSLSQIAKIGTVAIEGQERFYEYLNVTLSMDSSHEKEVAAIEDVVSVMPRYAPKMFDERQDIIMSGNLTGNAPTPGDYLAYLAGKGFTQAQFDASGFGVVVVDSGVDNGTLTPNHFGLYTAGSVANPDRLVFRQTIGAPGASAGHGCDGHGNLNTHIVGGYVPAGGIYAGFPHADAQHFRYGLGVAPFVRLGNSVIFDPGYTPGPDSDLYNGEDAAYANNMRISTNSWGFTGGFGSYNATTQGYDAVVRDAQPGVGGNQEYVIIFAAGNNGSGASTVAPPGTGKNLLSCAASENVQAFGGGDGCSIIDAEADSAQDIIFFSGRGPTNDGRVKPDLTAPGTHVSGGIAQSVLAGNPATGLGNADPCFDATGVCGGPAPTFDVWPLGQQWYTASSGTSHSTPAIAGAAALVRQHFINKGISPPTPAMTKATLMGTAGYMNGVGAGGNLPSNSQGMGLVNLNNFFDALTSNYILRDEVAGDLITSTGQIRSFTGVVADPSKPLRITMAFTDRFGPTVGAAWVNDLNLEVVAGGKIYRGNVFSGASSVTGGVADPRNNVESVILPAGVTGPVAIRVVGANIVADGVHNLAVSPQQDFALFASNITPQNIPVVALASSSLVSESCTPLNSSPDPGETVTLNFCFTNYGTASTSSLVASLQELGIILVAGPQNASLGVVAPGATVCSNFTFLVPTTVTCLANITAYIKLTDGATDLGTASYTTGTGLQPVTSTSIPVVISTAGPPGNTAPYPSTINVAGLGAGTITDLNVTLSGVNHTFPDDLDIILVGPGGQKVYLISDCGGSTDLVNVNLVIDDEAAGLAPDSGGIPSGSYRPTDRATLNETLPAPAPAGPYGLSLAVFDGLSPNGTWSLYVADAFSLDGGSIAGWSLNFTLSSPPPPPCATSCYAAGDFQLLKLDRPDPVAANSTLTYSIMAINPGPGALSNVVVTDPLPPLARFKTIRVPTGWTCTTPYPGTNGSVVCSIPILAPNPSSPAMIGIDVYAPAVCGQNKTITNTATITALGGADPDPSNNTASATTLVVGKPCFN